MADGGATVTGLAELKKAVQRLPDVVQLACRKVARDTALRVKNNAVEKVPVDSGITKDSIAVIPNVEEQFYRVETGPAPPHRREGRTAFLPNLPIWLEFGTRFKTARPFMRPAFDQEADRYVRDMTDAVIRTAKELLD